LLNRYEGDSLDLRMCSPRRLRYLREKDNAAYQFSEIENVQRRRSTARFEFLKGELQSGWSVARQPLPKLISLSYSGVTEEV
jgi:hypothetical protein